MGVERTPFFCIFFSFEGNKLCWVGKGTLGLAQLGVGARPMRKSRWRGWRLYISQNCNEEIGWILLCSSEFCFLLHIFSKRGWIVSYYLELEDVFFCLAKKLWLRASQISALFVWAGLAYKSWLKVLLADFVWEKNNVRWLINHGL